MTSQRTPDDHWRAFLTATDPGLPRQRRRMRLIPSDPRCKTCYTPFGAPGGWIMARRGRGRWEKNPNYCRRCMDMFMHMGLGGAEVEISMLFADIRGSTALAERLGNVAFRGRLNAFYRVATQVVVANDGVVDKFVGDEVVALFIPAMAGPSHGASAITAARTLLERLASPADPQAALPVGAGVHTGIAYVGLVGMEGGEVEFTALGDAVNVTARLASAAAAGEVLVSEAAWKAAKPEALSGERRRLEIRGRSEALDVVSLRNEVATPAASTPD